MINKINYSLLLLSCLAIFSCKKTEETVPDKSRFYNGNSEAYVTPFALYQLNNSGSNEATYSLSFYDKNIEYSVTNTTFYGWGNMLTLNFSHPIFKEGNTEQFFNVDNLQEGVFDIDSGNVWINYDFTQLSSGYTIPVISGNMTVWKYKDRYKLNYKLVMENGSSIEGAFWNAMSIVYE